MYKGMRTQVKSSVGLTDKIPVSVGLHQGSSLIPYLFPIIMDALACGIKELSQRYMLYELADRVITSMDHNETPINIYLDLSKAFDTLDHEILLAKLQYYGIHGTPLELLKSYLTNRKQYVEIEDTKSKMLDISTGVPQGSILGPLLFIIYVNDFALSSDKFKFVMYADDTTLTSKLETFSNKELNCNPASSINIELKCFYLCLCSIYCNFHFCYELITGYVTYVFA